MKIKSNRIDGVMPSDCGTS